MKQFSIRQMQIGCFFAPLHPPLTFACKSEGYWPKSVTAKLVEQLQNKFNQIFSPWKLCWFSEYNWKKILNWTQTFVGKELFPSIANHGSNWIKTLFTHDLLIFHPFHIVTWNLQDLILFLSTFIVPYRKWIHRRHRAGWISERIRFECKRNRY